MYSGFLDFDGTVGSIAIPLPDLAGKGPVVVISPTSNVKSWVAYDFGTNLWKVYVSDSTFVGKVYYSIIE
jgi:hypothetical protein